MRIYLIGYMGSGKTTLGKELAAKLKYRFMDLDKQIEKKTKKTIAAIFKKKGEEKFRVIEKKELRETKKLRNIVIATGGGTPCSFDNMDWMNEHGLTIYLDVSAGVLFYRLVREKVERPLLKDLTDVELMEQIVIHLTTRESFYSKAKLVVQGEKSKMNKLVKTIKKEL